VVVTGDAGSLLLTGDLLHVPPQVARLEVSSNHDVDPEAACRSRLHLLERARAGGWHVAVSHFGRPFGWVEDDGWRSSPVGG
jgi:hypothetical protein